jgi:hypothetical protein
MMGRLKVKDHEILDRIRRKRHSDLHIGDYLFLSSVVDDLLKDHHDLQDEYEDALTTLQQMRRDLEAGDVQLLIGELRSFFLNHPELIEEEI